MKVDYIALSIPIFFILIAIELAYSFYKKLKYYRFNDSIANLSQGIGSQIVGLFMKTALFFGYSYIYENWRLFDLPQNIWIWLSLFIGVDFFYYWFHRLSHQINALWAAHIVHHQSEEYNLTVALRQSWFQGWFSWVFYLPLAFIGFDPLMFLTVSSFNTLYQFWIHTRTIKNMGILEYFFNTPSHHRVHHGSNPIYIDKNHGGTLIIWDRLFGTFQKEEEDVYYGITTPLASWNPVWANIHYWVELWDTAKQTDNLKDKIKVFIKSPGWFPEKLGGYKSAPAIDVLNYKKYDLSYGKPILYYVFFQFIIALIVASSLLFLYSQLNQYQLITLALLTILTLVSCGALLENKKWVKLIEVLRITLVILIVILFYENVSFKLICVSSILLLLISWLWFYLMHKEKKYVT